MTTPDSCHRTFTEWSSCLLLIAICSQLLVQQTSYPFNSTAYVIVEHYFRTNSYKTVKQAYRVHSSNADVPNMLLNIFDLLIVFTTLGPPTTNKYTLLQCVGHYEHRFNYVIINSTYNYKTKDSVWSTLTFQRQFSHHTR